MPTSSLLCTNQEVKIQVINIETVKYVQQRSWGYDLRPFHSEAWASHGRHWLQFSRHVMKTMISLSASTPPQHQTTHKKSAKKNVLPPQFWHVLAQHELHFSAVLMEKISRQCASSENQDLCNFVFWGVSHGNLKFHDLSWFFRDLSPFLQHKIAGAPPHEGQFHDNT